MRVLTWILGMIFLLSVSTAEAEYTHWEDSSYDFKQVQKVYIAELDTSDVTLPSIAKEQIVKEELVKRVSKIKGLSIVTAKPTFPKAQLFQRVQKASEVEAPIDVHVIPKEAIDEGASLYILPRLTVYQVDSYLEPAHTEWKSREVRDSWRDKDGNWHDFYRTETYPIFIPDQYVPYCSVTVTFEWYDTQTGYLVASSEDSRSRVSENQPQNLYERIVDRFAKNMKKMIVK